MTNDTLSGLMGHEIRSVNQLLYQGQNNNSPPDPYYFVMNFHVDHTVPPQIIKTCFPGIRTYKIRALLSPGLLLIVHSLLSNLLEREGRYKV